MDNYILIHSGNTSDIYEYDKKILKLYKKQYSKNDVLHEFNINKKIEDLNLFIPKTYEIIEYKNRYGILFEKIQGKTLLSLFLNQEINTKYFAKELAKVHFLIQKDIDFKFPDNKNRLRNCIISSNIIKHEIKTKLLKYIDILPNEDKLCHGDLHPDNIIISQNQSYIIDWVNATKGNQYSDISRTIVLIKYTDLPKDSVINKERNNFLNEYINHYLNLSKAKLNQIEEWELPNLAARLIENITNEEKEILLWNIENKLKSF